MSNRNLRRLLVATHNSGKVAEFADLLDDDRIDWLTLADAGIQLEVDENGETFQENAILKATAYAKLSGFLTLADDSGLEVDALGGRPGVMTARFGGEGLSSAQRYRLLLEAMAGVPERDRGARFRCVIALAAPDGSLLGTADGVCEGRIALEPRGIGGFGYDPIFYLPGRGVTMAELSAGEKHRISHRGRAAYAIGPLLRRTLRELEV